MKYWFTIREEVSEEDARALWDKISKYNANLTLLPDRLDVYGDATSPVVLQNISEALVGTGYPVERGNL